MSTLRHACPCCVFLTLPEKPPGTSIVCPVCYWEDDDVQFKNPEYEGGANRVSLRQARKSFREIGAVSSEFRERVRAPTTDERPPTDDGLDKGR